jgi:hypothetical protein
MASLDITGKKGKKLEIAPPAQSPWPWLTRPADFVPLSDLRQIQNRANDYFTTCYERDIRPTLTGLSLAVGVPGPTSLQRLAQRRPELRWMISRCLTAVAHSYETMIAEGGSPAGPTFMLKQIPEFDPDEPAGSKPVQYWTDRRELVINARVHGARRPEDEGSELTPRESYLRVIHGQADDDILEGPLDVSSEPKANSLMELLSSGDLDIESE